MHVGPNKSKCSTLKIHGEEMLKANEQKYLGDIVSNTGNKKGAISDMAQYSK